MVSVVIGINWGNVGFTAAYHIFLKVYNSSFSKAPLHRPVLVFILSVLYHRIIILIQGATKWIYNVEENLLHHVERKIEE